MILAEYLIQHLLQCDTKDFAQHTKHQSHFAIISKLVRSVPHAVYTSEPIRNVCVDKSVSNTN